MTKKSKVQVLPGSKWTRLNPTDKEKHFEVVNVYAQKRTAEIRAVMSGRISNIQTCVLFDQEKWVQGWK